MQSGILPSQVSGHIETLERKAVDAFRDHDFRLMEEMHDPQCIGVGILGAQYTKTEFIAAFRDKLNVRAIDLVSTKIVLENSFAVVLSNWDVNIEFGHAMIAGRVRVTRTWVKRASEWKIISFHFSDARLATTWEKLKSANR